MLQISSKACGLHPPVLHPEWSLSAGNPYGSWDEGRLENRVFPTSQPRLTGEAIRMCTRNYLDTIFGNLCHLAKRPVLCDYFLKGGGPKDDRGTVAHARPRATSLNGRQSFRRRAQSRFSAAQPIS